ncbi:DUF4236 domain-containing protein [Acidocella sp.]|uniref:DUF4236 domain-containing protein n=1 Tax=Acidocella sp. TaxID=50710 RepID=UPI0017D6DF09|nr:DUF4236 domain-containing protein [Acidocella sp.]NNM56304.1 DUF4236 domain-containing protein [Acidocella sp.]
MGFRFRKRFKIAPGIRVNLSKSGASLSVGKPGSTVNFGKRGERVTTGIPGTGLSYSKQFSADRRPGGAKPGPSLMSYVIAAAFIFWVVVHFIIR